MTDTILPLEALAETRLGLQAAEAGEGIAPWMTQQEAVKWAKAEIAKLEAIIARYGNQWPCEVADDEDLAAKYSRELAAGGDEVRVF